jgi:hypothetical protein
MAGGSGSFSRGADTPDLSNHGGPQVATIIERIQMQVTHDAMDMGVRAAQAEKAGLPQGLPPGMGAYAMGFFNAVKLITAVPEVLPLLVAAWDDGVDTLGPNAEREAKVDANLGVWFETWREVIGG